MNLPDFDNTMKWVKFFLKFPKHTNKMHLIKKIDKVIGDYKEASLKSQYNDLSDLGNDALVKNLEVRALHIIETATKKDDVFRKQAYYQDGSNVGIFKLIGILEALKMELNEKEREKVGGGENIIEDNRTILDENRGSRKNGVWQNVKRIALLITIIAAIAAILAYFGIKPKEKDMKGFNGDVDQKVTDSPGAVQVAGDMAGDVNISIDRQERKNSKNKEIIKARIKIQRNIEDYQANLDRSVKDYYKQADKIAGNFTSRGMLTSGVYIKAQMDFAIETKKKIDKLFVNLNRNIEDALLESFDTPSLLELSEFGEENQQVAKEKEKLKEIYKRIEDNVRSWEVKVFREVRLTKDFHL